MQPQDIEETKKEIGLLVQLTNSPFIVTYREAFTERLMSENCLCIVMDFCEGGDLHDFINRRASEARPFSEKTLKTWLLQLCVALNDIHKRKIVHRDLKPGNIFLDSQNFLNIGDFGLSKVLQHTMARLGTICGTLPYMSPELAQGKAYSTPADIWAVGCIMYEAATFKRVVNLPGNASLYDVQQAILKNPMPTFPNTYSKELCEICNSMLLKDPSKRPTAAYMLLNPYLTEEYDLWVAASKDESQAATA
eukprot:GHVT01047808.1.p1 GENE.GHVT01047808.1~~GHVT01047808.1.p1  ORF type:complete len:250 (+),score=16.03 GHVT01047808.1:996-1745(+)